MRHSIGIGRGEQGAHRRTLGVAEQRGARRSDLAHDRVQIVHALFERDRAGDAIRQALPPFVERDDTREFGEPPQPVRVAGEFVSKLDMGDDAGHDDQINRALADRLIGDVDVAALGVACDRKIEIVHGLDFP